MAPPAALYAEAYPLAELYQAREEETLLVPVYLFPYHSPRQAEPLKEAIEQDRGAGYRLLTRQGRHHQIIVHPKIRAQWTHQVRTALGQVSLALGHTLIFAPGEVLWEDHLRTDPTDRVLQDYCIRGSDLHLFPAGGTSRR